jgi:hypothetical protein
MKKLPPPPRRTTKALLELWLAQNYPHNLHVAGLASSGKNSASRAYAEQRWKMEDKG